MKKVLFFLQIVLIMMTSIPVTYAGYRITQLTKNSYDDSDPRINNKGNVVWSGNGEIFLYNGKTVKQLTDNNYHNSCPSINDHGYVVWHGFPVFGLAGEIFLYDGANVKQLTDDSYYDMDPDINDDGYIVWKRLNGRYAEILLYDGIRVKQLTDKADFGVKPNINNSGSVVWTEEVDHCTQIFLYDSENIKQLTNNYLNNEDPQINDNGYVVWSAFDNGGSQIFLYDGISIRQITNNYNAYASHPQINNRGVVVWDEWSLEGYIFEKIFVYDGNEINQVSYNPYGDYVPQINDNVAIVWQGYKVNDLEVFIATPTVDFVGVIVLFPNGGEVIPSGGIFGICWQAPSNAVKFDLEYSPNNGTSWNFIKSVTGLNCTHWEEIPVVTANKKKCRVRVMGYDSNGVKVGEDISDKPFTIEVLKVTTPDGGETLRSGNTWTLRWVAHETIRPVAKTVLKYTTNGGSSWMKIKALTGNPGSYDWTVPNVSSTKSKFKVILKDANGVNIGTDVSDKVFTIQP